MNKVILIGRLTKDVELRYTVEQKPFARFTLAVDRPPKRDGTKDTDFIRITTFGSQAESCDKYLAKGRLVCVEGAINVNKYEKDDETRYQTGVVATKVEFLEWGKREASGYVDDGSKTPTSETTQASGSYVLDDDIPF